MYCSQGIVKRFFNEKEVTSTLVMDALYSGCRQLEAASAAAAQVCRAPSPVSLEVQSLSPVPYAVTVVMRAPTGICSAI